MRLPWKPAYAVASAALVLVGMAAPAAAVPDVPGTVAGLLNEHDPTGCGPYRIGVYADPGYDEPFQLDCVQPLLAPCGEVICQAVPR